MMPANTGIFLRGLKLSGESKHQFEKERHTLLCILKLFTNIIHQLSLKNAWLPPIFFLDFNDTC